MIQVTSIEIVPEREAISIFQDDVSVTREEDTTSNDALIPAVEPISIYREDQLETIDGDSSVNYFDVEEEDIEAVERPEKAQPVEEARRTLREKSGRNYGPLGNLIADLIDDYFYEEGEEKIEVAGRTRVEDMKVGDIVRDLFYDLFHGLFVEVSSCVYGPRNPLWRDVPALRFVFALQYLIPDEGAERGFTMAERPS